MLEIMFSFFLITVFTILIFNIKSKKQTNELHEVIKILKKQGETIEQKVQLDFQLTIEQAIYELERLQSGLIKLIYYLTNNIKYF